MIKIVFTFILISVSLFFVESNQYANFLPFSSDECSGDPYGIGYSIRLNGCISAISSNLFLTFKNISDENSLMVEQYDGGDCSPNNPTTISEIRLNKNNNTCIVPPYLQEINGTINPPILYTKVVISDTPIFSKDSVVFGQFDGQCISDNLLYSYSFSNGLALIEDNNNNITDTYICPKNRPGLQYCIAGKCITKKIEEKCIGTTDIKISAFCQN
ncbi:hypothetical protein RB653_002622 [Dictyostelium firmibasis]|uniref:Uncharacterized protein n=1 Tax=Dictyostelium firmibasis TaxID=79012 RepID=A0AAN7TXW6_9MYCE